MAAPKLDTAGVGGTAGAVLATLAPLYFTGDVWFVRSTTGSDSYDGRDREKPLATLAQAHTNAAAGDWIVCLSGHVETLSSAQTFGTAGILLLGEGTGSSRPRFTRAADINMFDVTAAGVRIENVFFPATTTTASTKSRVRFAGVNDQLVNCYFESGANDTGPAAETVTGASQVVMRSSTFISTAVALSAQPASAIKVTNAITDLQLGGDGDGDALVVNGGTYGWSTYAVNLAAAVTRLRATKVDLLNGSDVIVTTGSTGWIQPRNVTGMSRIVWPA